jgi:membrane dipeptidase
MGREVIAEMNRVGLVVDMSHSAERSTLEAMEVSARPIAITHANPAFWHAAKRNKSDTVLRALAETGGMLGFSLYPHHLKGGSDCTLAAFCEMIARTAEVMGVERLGIGSDLCQDQPDSVVEWMRVGPLDQARGLRRRLRRRAGLPAAAGILPRQPGFPGPARGLAPAGFDSAET